MQVDGGAAILREPHLEAQLSALPVAHESQQLDHRGAAIHVVVVVAAEDRAGRGSRVERTAEVIREIQRARGERHPLRTSPTILRHEAPARRLFVPRPTDRSAHREARHGVPVAQHGAHAREETLHAIHVHDVPESLCLDSESRRPPGVPAVRGHITEVLGAHLRVHLAKFRAPPFVRTERVGTLDREPEGVDRERVTLGSEIHPVRHGEQLATHEPCEDPKDRAPLTHGVRGRDGLEPLLRRQPELPLRLGVHGLHVRHALQAEVAEDVEPRFGSAHDREVAAQAHDVPARRIEVHLTEEDDALGRHVRPQGDVHTNDRDLAIAHPHRDDRVAARVAVEPFAIVGERMHGEQRGLPSTPPRTTAIVGGVPPEEERQPIPVERGDRPPAPEEPDARERRADALRAIAHDRLRIPTGPVPSETARDLLERDRHLHAFGPPVPDRDLALEARGIAAEPVRHATVHLGRLGDQRAQRGRGIGERIRA